MQKTLVILAILTALSISLSSVDSIHAQTFGTAPLGPSFPCPSPRDPLAELICSSPDLAQADLRYVQAYQALRQQTGDAGQKLLRQEAVAFTVQVRDRCNIAAPDSSTPASPDSVPCVMGQYSTERNVLASRLLGPASEEALRSLQEHVGLQADLRAVGFLPVDATIDGVYGPATRAAIAQWQQKHGLLVTGLLGNVDAARLQQQTATASSTGLSPISQQPSMTASRPTAGAQSATTEQDTDLFPPGPSFEPNLPLSIPLQGLNGTLVVPVMINGTIVLKFVIDSGAADVTLPADVVLTLIRAGTIDDTDFLGSKIYMLADGSKAPSDVFRIRVLRIGNVEINDVTASIGDVRGPLLLGQSFLQRFKSWSIDNQREVLVLNR